MNENGESQMSGVVVVGVDGSPGADEALRWAAAEASLRKTRLRVVHAWTFVYPGVPGGGLGPMGGSIGPFGAETLRVNLNDMHRAAEGLLESATADLEADFEGVEIECVVVEGAPAEALVGAAAENDLLVVGSRGHGGFASLLLGSVSQQCAHHAPCPVVIVHTPPPSAGGHEPAPEARTESGSVGPLSQRTSTPAARRVLVLTNEDLADANEVPEAIRPFLDQAEQIYVVAPTLTTWMQWLCDDRDSALVSADARLRTVFEHMRAGGLEPQGAVGAENQVTAIADALGRFDADLILLRLHAPGMRHENWREPRIAEQVRSRFAVRTIVFYFDSEGHVIEREEA